MSAGRERVPEARALMERVLRDGQSLAPEFPLVFDPGATGHIETIVEDGRVVSACAVLERELITGAGVLPVGMIGSVATDPACRRRGFATRLLAAAEERLRSAGIGLALLWADEPSFYELRAWRPVGAERDLVLPCELIDALPAPGGVRAAVDRDAQEIHALYRAHALHVARGEAETARLLTCPNMRVVVAERDGRIDGYACLERGADFKDTIHEWGGDPDGVAGCVRALLVDAASHEKPGLFLIAPSPEPAPLDRLTDAGASATDGSLGLGKVVDRGVLAAWVDARLEAGTARVEQARVELHGPAGCASLADDELLGLILRQPGADTLVPTLRATTGLALEAFPADAFVWGLDSI